MKLKDVKFCNVCRYTDMIYVRNHPVEDLYDGIVYKEALVCTECDTVHHIDGGVLIYDFPINFNNRNFTNTYNIFKKEAE